MKDKDLKKTALGIALHCVRNTLLENIHAGITPKSLKGDGSDIYVVTPHGTIPWNEVSRINNTEIKAFMIEVVNKIYTYQVNRDNVEFSKRIDTLTQRSTYNWNEPEYLDNWFKKQCNE